MERGEIFVLFGEMVAGLVAGVREVIRCFAEQTQFLGSCFVLMVLGGVPDCGDLSVAFVNHG